MSRCIGVHTECTYTVFSILSNVLFFPQTDDLPYLKCPLHTVLKLTPVAYGRTGDKDALLTYSTINTHVRLLLTFLHNSSLQVAKWKCFI